MKMINGTLFHVLNIIYMNLKIGGHLYVTSSPGGGGEQNLMIHLFNILFQKNEYSNPG